MFNCVLRWHNIAVTFLVGCRQFLHFMWKFASQKEKMMCLPCSNLKSFMVAFLHTLLLCRSESKFLMYVS